MFIILCILITINAELHITQFPEGPILRDCLWHHPLLSDASSIGIETKQAIVDILTEEFAGKELNTQGVWFANSKILQQLVILDKTNYLLLYDTMDEVLSYCMSYKG